MNKAIFVFDLHDVLFKRNYWYTVKLIWLIQNKFQLLIILLNPFCIYDAFKMLRVTRVSEAYLIKLSKKHTKLEPFVETIIDITNAIIPDIQMFNLVEQLKHNGHRLYIFSNIGQFTYEKLTKDYQHLFNYFDGIHYVRSENDWLAKPNYNAYKEFLKKFNIDPHTMVFIDDKQKNIHAAQHFGITGLIYRSSTQIIKALHYLKLLS